MFRINNQYFLKLWHSHNSCVLLISITENLLQKILTIYINATKLNSPTQILHYIIRILIKSILAYDSGKQAAKKKEKGNHAAITH